MSEREQLEQAMAALEAQRSTLGNAAVDAALAGLRQKLASLDGKASPSKAWEGERRVVTILFCDVKGSTALAEKMDPEEWTGIMNRAFQCLIDPVQHHEGNVARLMGDAILAFFGAPTAHEDDPRRAVRAGLEILQNISALRGRLERELGIDLNVRVGINTGLVVVGQVGSEFKGEYTAMGDSVNLAARMEQTAKPGTVQIADATYKLVEPFFEFEPLGGIQVKGRNEPVSSYRVTGVKARGTNGRGLEGHGLSSALVGREQELSALQGCLNGLSATATGGIVGIIGEAGLGKSRLVAEAHRFASENIANVLWQEGQTLSYGRTISYWPFQQILRGWAGIADEDDAEAAWHKLETRVRASFSDETNEYLPYLASLLAIPVQGEYEERVKYLDGEAMGKQIFLTARRFFRRLASEGPAVLVFEDLHWMDQSSTALLEHLFPLTRTVPLLIIGLSRPERETPAARLRELCTREYGERYTEIRLDPLTDTAGAELVRNLLDIENLPTKLRELILAKAEGNPFFIEEVVRALIDTGAVVRDPTGGKWRATAQTDSIDIPDTVQGVIMARVDRLDEEVKRVLRIASVIGRSFLYRILQALTEAGKHLDADLAELQASELIHEKQHLPELEYMFKHALAQEATYESILLAKRRELHARVAGAIESLFGERLEEFYGLLAYHYAQAEAWDKAQAYLLKAADQAGRMAADAEALNLYQQAMAAYARAFGDKWNPAQRASLERKMGEAFFRRGEYAQATEHFRQALGYLGYRLPMSSGEVRLALLRELLVQVGHRLWPGFVKPTARRISSSAEEEMWVYYRLVAIDAVSNPERFLVIDLRQVNVSEKRGLPLGIATGCHGLGLAFDLIGLFPLAGWYQRYGLAAAEKLGLPYALASGYSGLQCHQLYSGEPGLGTEYGRRSLQAYYQAGDIFMWALPASQLAWGLAQLGDLAGAIVQSQELVQLGRDAESREAWCWGETTLGYALRRSGRVEEAMAHEQKAVELAEGIPDHIYRVQAGADLALCYLRQGDYERALSELETCTRVRAEHRVIDSYGEVTILINLAEAFLYAAEHGEASERPSWLNKANAACRNALKQAPKFKVKRPKAMRLRGTYEWLRGSPAAAQKWWDKSLAEAERLELRYDIAMGPFEMGQRLGDRAHLERAEGLFREIGAELDLANTRRLLQGKTVV